MSTVTRLNGVSINGIDGIMSPHTRVGRHIAFPLGSVGLSVCLSQNRVRSITRQRNVIRL